MSVTVRSKVSYRIVGSTFNSPNPSLNVINSVSVFIVSVIINKFSNNHDTILNAFKN